MSLINRINQLWRPAHLSRGRMAFALAVAVIADGLQLALGPLGWFGTVQFLDVAAMILTMIALGFHLLLLPTFLLEFIPVVDMIPTWTGCVAAVLALRKRGETTDAPTLDVSPPSPPPVPDARLLAPASTEASAKASAPPATH